MSSKQLDRSLLHQDLKLRKKQIKSSQANIYFVKKENIISENLVLKVFKSDELSSYRSELDVFMKLADFKSRCKREVPGFPRMISH